MRRIVLLICVVGTALAGCSSDASSNSADYVGEYVFRPAIPVPAEFADFVILKENQEAIEIRFDKGTGEVSTKKTRWSLSRTTGQNVSIDDFSCPVEGSRNSIRLGLNDDLGQYYEKIR
jgi:hypothetical protein